MGDRALWEGLVGPSSDRWLGIRLLATRAQTAKTQDDRATLYGDLLATCARCHAKIRDR